MLQGGFSRQRRPSKLVDDDVGFVGIVVIVASHLVNDGVVVRAF